MASDNKKTGNTVQPSSKKSKSSDESQEKGIMEKREALRQQLTDMELAMTALKEKFIEIRNGRGEISPTEEKAADKSSLSGYEISDIIAVMFDLERKRLKERPEDDRMREFDAKIQKHEKQIQALEKEFESKKKPGRNNKKR